MRNAVLHEAHTDRTIAVAQHVDHLRVHVQVKVRILRCALREEAEKIGLRHDHHVGVARLQTSEIHQRQCALWRVQRDAAHLRVRQRMQRFGKTDLVEHVERRCVHRVTAEIAVEILVHFQQRHVDTAARQQQGSHHPGRTAADENALRLDDCHQPVANESQKARSSSIGASSTCELHVETHGAAMNAFVFGPVEHDVRWGCRICRMPRTCRG